MILDALELETTEYRGELWCPCPLPFGNHPNGDRNASFSINIENPNKMGLYNCFVCGGGNIIQLVSLLKELPYSEAEEWVAAFSTGSEDRFEEHIKFLLDLKDQPDFNKEEMPVYPNDALFQYRYIHPWMRSQGISDEGVKHFQLGWDEDRNGILFPHWWQGKLVGWQIRDLDPEAKNKYRNTPQFPKRNTLYHFDCDCVKQSDSVIVVESPKSVGVLWSLGTRNVVATFGAGSNPEQMEALWGFDEVLLWFDNDEAGAKATRTATKYLKDMVRLYRVPAVEKDKGDPGDLKSAEEVSYYLAQKELL